MQMILVQWILHTNRFIFCNIASEYDPACVLWYWGSSSEFFRWLRSINDAKWTFLPLFLASRSLLSCFWLSSAAMPGISRVFTILSPQASEEFVHRTVMSYRIHPFAVMWFWCVFCLSFPNIAVGFSTSLCLYFARHCCWHRNFQLSTSGFHCELEFFVFCFNREYSS